jgi:hypothetical protein
MAARKQDEDTDEVGTKHLTVEREQKGGTILEEGRPVAYTREGALSAVPGGPPDPTILPEGEFLENEPPASEGEGGDAEGVKMVDRADAAPLTGDEKA